MGRGAVRTRSREMPARGLLVAGELKCKERGAHVIKKEGGGGCHIT